MTTTASTNKNVVDLVAQKINALLKATANDNTMVTSLGEDHKAMTMSTTTILMKRTEAVA